ncbi:hypothetical protein T439DRAFT_384530 [Meredithblackwellia eburnea MCA 4105]
MYQVPSSSTTGFTQHQFPQQPSYELPYFTQQTRYDRLNSDEARLLGPDSSDAGASPHLGQHGRTSSLGSNSGFPPMSPSSPGQLPRSTTSRKSIATEYGLKPGMKVPVATFGATVIRVLLPLLTLPIITGLSWGFAFYTRRPLPVPAIASQLDKNPQLRTYTTTFIASILAILVSWSFGRSAAYFVAKRVAYRAHTVAEITSWAHLSTHQMRWSLSKWIVITGLSTALMSLLVPGFVSLFSPQPYQISASFSGRQEIDFSTPAFDDFYNQITAGGYPDCFWPDSRGIVTPSCAFSSGFFELLLGGRASVEAAQSTDQNQNHTTYSRVGKLNIAGPTAGLLPYNSIVPVGLNDKINSINLGNDSFINALQEDVVSKSITYALGQTLQGISAVIQCTWDSSSPIVSVSQPPPTTGLTGLQLVTTTAPSCNSNFSYMQYAPSKRASAASCRSANQWHLYVRLFEDYILSTNPADPTASQENLTCIVQPYLLQAKATYSSDWSTINITERNSYNSTPSPELMNHFDSHVRDLERSINNIVSGESAAANLVVEAINTLRLDGDKGSTQLAWEQLLVGMLELDATFARHNWDYLARLPNSTFAASGWRPVPATLTFDGRGWETKFTTLLLLIPVSALCLATIFFAIGGFMTPGDLLTFDPSDYGSLVLATARGNLATIAAESDKNDDSLLRVTRMKFKTNVLDPNRPWGLFR